MISHAAHSGTSLTRRTNITSRSDISRRQRRHPLLRPPHVATGDISRHRRWHITHPQGEYHVANATYHAANGGIPLTHKVKYRRTK